MNANLKFKSAFPFFDNESVNKILADVETTLRNGVLTGGPRTRELEEKFSRYTGTRNAIAVSSGGASLEVALRYFGVKDREVIVPTNTFVATPNSVVFAGGRPVFADIREDTLCLDSCDVECRITPKTRGVIVVHIAGLVCPQIYELRRICHDYGLFLIEDCAHAHGAKIDNRMAGSLSDAGCFSFAPTKVMTTGEGGMVVTDNGDLAEGARSMRNRGLNSERLMVMLGHSWCMSEMSAIIGIHQLEKLDFFVSKRNEIARQYEELLAGTQDVSLFRTPPNIQNSYHKYPVRLSSDISLERTAKLLAQNYGVETGSVYYPPCHLHPYYKETLKTHEGDLPVAENVLKSVLCLPIHLGLSGEHVEYISKSLKLSIKESRT